MIILNSLNLFVALILLAGCQENLNKNLPEKLVGVTLNYKYSGGNEYTVKIEKEGLSYQFKTGPKPEKWWGPFSNNYMITQNNEHFVAWHEPGYGDYITLLINFESKVLYGSGIIGGKNIHFQKAKIAEVIVR